MLNRVGLLRSLFLAVITPTVKAVTYQFIQLPIIVQLISYSVEQNVSVSNVNGCTALIKSTTVALQYMPTALRCISYSKLQGFNTQTTGNIYYLKIAGKCGSCATSSDAKTAILNYVYENNACPDTFFTYDQNTGYCVGSISSQVKTVANTYFSNYASYTQGAYTNGTLLTMSRGLAAKALSVSCPFSNSTAATFNGNWYCYTQFPTPSPSPTYITQNVCGSWISGGTLIKFVHAAEAGYLSIRNGATSYFGAYLPTGSPNSASNYIYYDGTPIPSQYVNWYPGKPSGKQLVYMDNRIMFEDYDQTRMSRLLCRNPTSAPA